ncbi:MAG TPA: hypothetical protein VH394_25515 [Thermoanaerobaculia bacterium]|jgi:hypothetical protein|nr:hypothetical protein [Thermoanaerobaculia bacterium]
MIPIARKLALTLLVAFAALPATAKELGPFNITLRYSPQESVGTSVPTLMLGVSDIPVRLSIEDGRTIADPAVIGDSTDDDDRVWPVRAATDLLGWANEVLLKNAGEWGIRVSDSAPFQLKGSLLRFMVNESNKPVGSVYNADIRVAFRLLDSRGNLLWEGNAAGDATRYGKSRNEDNVNEVLSDALKEAYATALGDTGLQNAWLGKSEPMAVPAAAPSMAAAMSPDELLAELLKLKKQGFGADLLVDFVNQKSLKTSLSADDMVKWKKEGMPQDVIQAALKRAP